MKVALDSLQRFGLSRADFASFTDQLREKETKENRELLDDAGRLTVSALDTFATEFSVAIPTDRIRAALKPVPGATRLPKTAFPEAKASVGEARTHAARPGDPEIPYADLGRFSGLVDFLRSKPEDGNSIPASQLLRRLWDGVAGAHRTMFPAVIEAATVFAASAAGPAHTERDGTIDVSSIFTPLAESKDGAKVYKRAYLDRFFPRLSKGGGAVELHAFQNESIVVTVPKGGSVFLVDGKGDQTAAFLRPQKMNVDGVDVQAVEIGPGIAGREGIFRDVGPSVTLKVLDESGNPTLEKSFTFNGGIGRFSTKLWTAPIGYQDLAGSGLEPVHFDHYVPSATDNKVPLGQRPRITIDGQDTDRLKIVRDGKAFTIDRLLQLLDPSGKKTYVNQEPGKKGVVFLERRSGRSIDDADYDPIQLARVTTSFGHGSSFDPGLSQSKHARIGSQGVTVYETGTRKPVARFDPLAPPKH